MKIIVYKRRIFIWNMLLFLIFLLFFLFVEGALCKDKTALNIDLLISFLEDKKYLLVLWGISIFFVYKVHRLSSICVVLMTLSVFIESIILLSENFNNVVLVFLVVYLIIAYYFYYLWGLELSEAIYNPLLNNEDVDFRPKLLMKVELQIHEGQVYKGIFTNWNESGCHLLFDEKIYFKSREVRVDTTFGNRHFSSPGEIYTSSYGRRGIGIILKKDKKEYNFGWAELYQILEDMGYLPKQIN